MPESGYNTYGDISLSRHSMMMIKMMMPIYQIVH